MITEKIQCKAAEAVNSLYGIDVESGSFTINKTRKEFDGDFTVVVFPLTKQVRKSPEALGHEMGEWMRACMPEIEAYNVIKGFLNLSLREAFWTDFLADTVKTPEFGKRAPGKDSRPVLIEYSSPNTNNPLHLGHIRNNLLGHSIARILAACGENVIQVNLVNDRGIHICKSMLAWQKWGNGETPRSASLKGDHLVGKYYVRFDQEYKNEIALLKEKGVNDETAARTAPLILEAQELLRKWEDGDAATVSLWKMMNEWVYEGFDDTYRKLGIVFDKTYHESATYLTGKGIVEEGLRQSVFRKNEDGSVWVDLTEDGLDEKLLLRADGTSVYITQDLGTAQLRYDEFEPGKMVYVVGNEQIYHFDVLKLILKKLAKPFAEGIFHLSYGMVELPHGKMKSREGTVVDADDLISEMISTARETTLELGKAADFGDEEAEQLFQTIGLAALKYFILKVDPRKNMLFNPAESIDFDGNTGPFIQYTYARIRSVIRKAGSVPDALPAVPRICAEEREVLRLLYDFPGVVSEAGQGFNPSMVAMFTYELARTFNQFYHQHSILHEPDKNIRSFRLMLSDTVAKVIATAMDLLGIGVPERM